jgi:hypothetical protein
MTNPHIPIFIIVHDRLLDLQKSVDSYEKYIQTPYKIIFHNVASTYKPTLDYLNDKKKDGYIIYESKVNNHHTVIDSAIDYLNKNKECEYYVITDPDIELDNVNGDILEYYSFLLDTFKVESVGPMLRIDDIPNHYPRKANAIKGHTTQFWNKKPIDINYNNNTFKYIKCRSDTTFQLRSRKNISKKFPHTNAIRCLQPYAARHLDWYINPNNLSPCQKYYINNTTTISHWANPKWKGSYYGAHINNIKINNKKTKPIITEPTTIEPTTIEPIITEPTTIEPIITKLIQPIKSVKPSKPAHILWCQCKCKGGRNFGDVITPYIYKKITGLNSINGVSKNKTFICAGSIISKCTSNCVVWGTGAMFGTEKFKKPSQILSVRGPLTRKRFLELGYKCPETYGDIGLILPNFYNPKIDKKYVIGIIPHYVDYDKCKLLYKNNKNVLIIDLTNNVETVVNNLLLCEHTISSSLHGIIVSHAYNIKCAWMRVSNKIAGGNFKYWDYYMSVQINDKIEPIPLNKYIDENELLQIINTYPNPSLPIDTTHIMELCPF